MMRPIIVDVLARLLRRIGGKKEPTFALREDDFARAILPRASDFIAD